MTNNNGTDEGQEGRREYEKEDERRRKGWERGRNRRWRGMERRTVSNR